MIDKKSFQSTSLMDMEDAWNDFQFQRVKALSVGLETPENAWENLQGFNYTEVKPLKFVWKQEVLIHNSLC